MRRLRSHATPTTDADPSPPGPLLMLLEGRAPMEYLSMMAAYPWLRSLPKGDGHGVMVFPGMAANDVTTWPLRAFLDRLGYVTQAWGQGFNVGPRQGVLERCAADVQALFRRTGGPVSLIGWSLGGIYARETAKAVPDLARCVITLGTPFTGHPRATNAWRVYEWLTGTSVGDTRLLDQVRQTPPVPTTSIYSRTDGVVSWRCSLNPPSATAENIEVQGSHMGMGMNPLALYAIADRLAQPVGEWRPFETTGGRRWFFRTGSRTAGAAAA